MANLIINKSAFQSPVVNIETGETIGQSSIAIFRKKDLYMTYLVVNTMEYKEDPTAQLLIPFSEIASINDYSISVWLTDNEDSENQEPLSREKYMQLFDTPVYQKNGNMLLGVVSAAVLDTEGKLLAVAAQKDGTTKRYARDILARRGDTLLADVTESTPNSKPAAPARENTQPAEEPNNPLLEDLIKTVSRQISTLTDYIVESREEKKQQTPPVDFQSTMQGSFFREPESIASESLTIEEAPSLLEPVAQETPFSPTTEMPRFGAYEEPRQTSKEEGVHTDQSYQQLIAALARLEGKIDLLNMKPYSEPSDLPKLRQDCAVDALKDLAHEAEPLDLQPPTLDAGITGAPKMKVPRTETETSPFEPISLKQPMQTGADGTTKEKSRINIDSLMEELDMQRKKPSTPDTTESYGKSETIPVDSPKTEQASTGNHTKPTHKRNSAFWKVSGTQTISAVLFVAGYAAMSLFNVL